MREYENLSETEIERRKADRSRAAERRHAARCAALKRAVEDLDLTAVISLEWIVVQNNGGGVVLVRTAIIAALISTAGWGASKLMGEDVTATALISWFGAALAVVYAALYARFASQWSYLSGVYNDIMSVKCTTSATSDFSSDQRASLLTWKVGFIVDAWALHLTAKDPFPATIAGWLIRTKGLIRRYVELNGLEDFEKELVPLLEEHLASEQSKALHDAIRAYKAESSEPEEKLTAIPDSARTTTVTQPAH